MSTRGGCSWGPVRYLDPTSLPRGCTSKIMVSPSLLHHEAWETMCVTWTSLQVLPASIDSDFHMSPRTLEIQQSQGALLKLTGT
jgi:hypothetical protein